MAVKVTMISSPNAVVNPRAMMVKSFYTPIAYTTMSTSGNFDDFTNGTE